MPSILMNDLWTQTLSALIAGLLVLFVQARWVRGPKPPAQQSSASEPTHGNTAIVSGKTKGSVKVKQTVHDNRQTNTYIQNNINYAYERSGSSDAGGDALVYGLLGLLAVALAALSFVLGFPFIRGAAIGASIAVIIMNIVAVRRTVRLAAWTHRARITTAGTAIAVLANLVTWHAIGSTERAHLSLDSIRSTLPSFDSRPPGSGFSGFVDYISRSLTALLDTHDALPFTVSLLLAAALVSVTILLAWGSLLEWHAYLSFADGKDKSDRETRRARAFAARAGIGGLIVLAVFGVLGWLAADGRLYDFYLWYVELISTAP